MCNDVVGYHLENEDGGNKVLQNAGILSHHYMVAQLKRLKLETFLLFSPHFE